jgi:hypothetical protein
MDRWTLVAELKKHKTRSQRPTTSLRSEKHVQGWTEGGTRKDPAACFKTSGGPPQSFQAILRSLIMIRAREIVVTK